jgi:DNA-binding response OmpR family regulator
VLKAVGVKKFDFSSAQALLYCTEPGRRRILRDLLYSVGVQIYREPSSILDLRQIVNETIPDLIILDLDDGREDLNTLADDIRHDRVGRNPYSIIVAITSDTARGAVGGVLNAGFDDIIVRPLSLAILSERLEFMVENRKKFVVTPSYVGPDRRAGARHEGDELGAFPVPNTLRHKITGDSDAELNNRALDAARETTVRHRLHRIATRVTQLATQLETGEVARGAPEEPNEVRQQINALLDQMGDELDPRRHRHLLQLAGSMREVMTNILVAGHSAPSARMFELFRLHGQAMTASLTDAEHAGDLVVRAIGEATSVVGEEKQLAAG